MWGSGGGIAPHILNLSSNGQLHAATTLYPRKISPVLIERWGLW